MAYVDLYWWWILNFFTDVVFIEYTPSGFSEIIDDVSLGGGRYFGRYALVPVSEDAFSIHAFQETCIVSYPSVIYGCHTYH